MHLQHLLATAHVNRWGRPKRAFATVVNGTWAGSVHG